MQVAELLSPNTEVNERSSTKALVNEEVLLLEKPIEFVENCNYHVNKSNISNNEVGFKTKDPQIGIRCKREIRKRESNGKSRTLSLSSRNCIDITSDWKNLPFVIQILLLGGALLANGAAATGAAVETAG